MNFLLKCWLLFIFLVPMSIATEYQTGASVLPLVDKSRTSWDGKNPRPITTHLFYPTESKNTETLLLGEPKKELFNAGTISWNAAYPKGSRRPLLIFSHGTGGSALQLLWLANYFAEAGYIVAAMNHHGNTALEPSYAAQGFKLIWERAKDVSILIKELQKNTEWNSRIDWESVGFVGFSLGGYTGISAVGGITSLSTFDAFCQSSSKDFTCQPQYEFPDVDAQFDRVKASAAVQESLNKHNKSYQTPLIKSAVLIAPAVVQAFTSSSLKKIDTPTLVIAGSKDQVAPKKTNAQFYAKLAKNTNLETIDGAGHYSFLASCTEFGKKILPRLCLEPGNQPREKTHQQTAEKALAFFNRQFK